MPPPTPRWACCCCCPHALAAPHPTCSARTAGATLGSFLVALLHFALELGLFQTMGLATALQPMVVAGVSSLWMALGWNYYTGYAARSEPTMSEDVTVTQKDD